MEYNMGYRTMKYGKSFYDCLDQSEKIIIYGAGSLCKKCIPLFHGKIKEKIIAIAVTSMDSNDTYIDKIKVRPFEEYRNEKEAAVIIAIQDEAAALEVREKLTMERFEKILLADYSMLYLYSYFIKIKRCRDCFDEKFRFRQIDSEKVYNRALNIGKFLKEADLQKYEFHTLALAWGGAAGCLIMVCCGVSLQNTKLKHIWKSVPI